MKQDWVSISYQLLKKKSSTSGKHEASTFYQYFIKKSSLWVMLFQDHLRQQISSCDCSYRLFKELSLVEKVPTETFPCCLRIIWKKQISSSMLYFNIPRTEKYIAKECARYHLVIVHIDFSKNSLWGKRSRPRLSSHVAAGQTLSLLRQAPPRIHTHISSAGLVTRLESKKGNIKDCVFEQKTFVKTSSWLFSFEQFAKCLLSKEGEAFRKWDMTSLSWSKNFTLDLLIFLASW